MITSPIDERVAAALEEAVRQPHEDVGSLHLDGDSGKEGVSTFMTLV